MAKKNELQVIDFSPTLAVPDDAPALTIDPANAALSFDDMFPENFFSLEALQNWLNERGAESRVLTVTGLSYELLYDPQSEKPKDGRWLPCFSFEETTTKLVINKSRGNQLRRLTGSPLAARWADIGQICIYAGIDNSKAQICIKRPPKPTGENLADLNAELFRE